MIAMRISRLLLTLLPIAAAVFGSVAAQTFPSKPVTVVIPFPAGGPTDIIARMLGEQMRASLGQPVIFENVGGAGGNIGTGRVARAPADGHTLVVGNWQTHVVNAAIYSLPYDVLTDFEPVALLASSPQLLVAKSTFPANDLKGLIAWLQANPDKASSGISGIGGPGQITGVHFQSVTGTRYQFVPYRGAAPALQDLVAGQIDFMFDSPTTSLPQVRAGKVKAFAVTAGSRLQSAPDIMTAHEAGLPNFQSLVWTAMWAPKGTPKEVIERLNAPVVQALADPQMRARLADLGQQIPARERQTPESLAVYQTAEIEKWWPIIKAAGIKAE
jgi:tripartite-type tricarboxylate transporter receptor subunit TctC